MDKIIIGIINKITTERNNMIKSWEKRKKVKQNNYERVSVTKRRIKKTTK